MLLCYGASPGQALTVLNGAVFAVLEPAVATTRERSVVLPRPAMGHDGAVVRADSALRFRNRGLPSSQKTPTAPRFAPALLESREVLPNTNQHWRWPLPIRRGQQYAPDLSKCLVPKHLGAPPQRWWESGCGDALLDRGAHDEPQLDLAAAAASTCPPGTTRPRPAAPLLADITGCSKRSQLVRASPFLLPY